MLSLIHICKPFQMKVILAKIQALLRRTYSFGMDPSILTHKGVTLNLNSALLSYGTQTLELSRNELKILQVLLENKGTVVTQMCIRDSPGPPLHLAPVKRSKRLLLSRRLLHL